MTKSGNKTITSKQICQPKVKILQYISAHAFTFSIGLSYTLKGWHTINNKKHNLCPKYLTKNNTQMTSDKVSHPLQGKEKVVNSRF